MKSLLVTVWILLIPVLFSAAQTSVEFVKFSNPANHQNFITGQYEPMIYGSTNGGSIPGSGSSSLILQAGGTQTNRHIFFRTADQNMMFIGNNGYVGIGTVTPRGKFDVDGPGDIYLADDVNTGTLQNIYLPGHIFIAPHNGGNVSYLQARRENGSGTTSLRIRTFNNGNITDAMHVAGNGYVGIGTYEPRGRLDVDGPGDIYLADNVNTGTAQSIYLPGHIYVSPYNGGDNSYLQARRANNSGTTNFMIRTFNNGAATDAMFIAGNGDVGIGTSDPKGYKLAVKGKTISEEVVVKLHTNWPDYVFEPDYNLPSLEEIKNYIDQHKHLPEVPSAKEMEANGINLGEMNMILLKKVEELTLHLIRMEDVNARQQALIEKLIQKQ